MKFIKKTTWEEVFATWQANEGSDLFWQKFAREEKGWDSWEEWRGFQASKINAKNLDWSLYEIKNPNVTIPKFKIGPFKGWQIHFEKKNVHTFADLVGRAPEWVKNNVGIKSRLENFPQGTEFIGIYFEDTSRIVLWEGHHRASAVALAVANNDPIKFDILPRIAITSIKGDQTELLNRLLDSSANKPA